MMSSSTNQGLSELPEVEFSSPVEFMAAGCSKLSAGKLRARSELAKALFCEIWFGKGGVEFKWEDYSFIGGLWAGRWKGVRSFREENVQEA